jgi:hypothetical protein
MKKRTTSPRRKYGWVGWSVIGLVSLCPVLFYFYIYHDGWSNDYNAWVAFGTLWGAVFGSLAFVIAIRTVYAGRQNAEREQIFNLIELHQQKVEAVSYMDNGVRISGYDAFRIYAQQADKYLILHLILLELKTHGIKQRQFLSDFLSVLQSSTQLSISQMDISKYQQVAQNTNIPFDEWRNIAYTLSCQMSAEEKVQAIAEVYAQIYRENGHFLGQYFRNMYYALKTIEQSSFSEADKTYYAHLYRAQLSRYELALGVFNAVWELSSDDMVRLLLQYDILDDIYHEDVVLLFEQGGLSPYMRIRELLQSYRKTKSKEAR